MISFINFVCLCNILICQFAGAKAVEDNLGPRPHLLSLATGTKGVAWERGYANHEETHEDYQPYGYTVLMKIANHKMGLK